MSRQRFLIGVLCGLVLGVGICVQTQQTTSPERPAIIRPVSATPQPLRLPQRPEGVPPDVQRHEFNGGEYYVIPLASRG